MCIYHSAVNMCILLLESVQMELVARQGHKMVKFESGHGLTLSITVPCRMHRSPCGSSIRLAFPHAGLSGLRAEVLLLAGKK